MLLLAIFFISFLIPAVQTSVANRITNKLNKTYNTKINIDKVKLQINGNIALNSIYIEDYKNDTLISIEKLNTTIVSLNNFINGKYTFGDISIENLYFNYKHYKGHHKTNLDEFIYKFKTEEKPTKQPFLISSSDITIKGSQFKFTNENLNTPEILNFKNLFINTTNFVVNGSTINTRINKLSFFENRGIYLNNLQSNFLFSKDKMSFENLKINSKHSVLKGDLNFNYAYKDLKHFTDKVNVTANFKDSQIALSEVKNYYKELGNTVFVKLNNANISGTLNNFKAKNIRVTSANDTKILGDMQFHNIFNKSPFVMESNYKQLTTTRADLIKILPNLLKRYLPKQIDSLGKFTITGKTVLSKTNLDATITANTKIGNLTSKITLNAINLPEKTTYKGLVTTSKFNLGKLLNKKSIGEISSNLLIHGKGFTLKTLNSFVKGKLTKFNFNAYDYNNIEVSGNIKDHIFDGKLKVNDSNLNLNFNGLIDYTNTQNNYNFTASIKKANLNYLNFTKDSISVFKGDVTINMKGQTIDDVVGLVAFNNTSYKNTKKTYFFKDFKISSTYKNQLRYINFNSPEIITGDIKGIFKFKHLLPLTENAFGNIFTNYKAYQFKDAQFIDFDLNIHDKIAEVFVPNLNLKGLTTLKGHIENDAKKFKLKLTSNGIKYNTNEINDLRLQIDNSNKVYNTQLSIKNADVGNYKISDMFLINQTKNDSLFIKTEFNGGLKNNDAYNLSLFYTINNEGKSVLGFKKSTFNFNKNKWSINKNRDSNHKIIFDRGFNNLDIKTIDITHLNEKISISGNIINQNQKHIEINFTQTNLDKITPSIKNFKLNGIVNGNAVIIQNEQGYFPESNITIDNLAVNNFNLGAFKANVVGQKTLTNFDINMSLKNSNSKSLSVIGNLNAATNNPNIDLEVDFDQFILNPLSPLGKDVITDITGKIDGNVRIKGNLSKPDIIGDLFLSNGGIKIPYLNVNYNFNEQSKIGLNKQTFYVNNLGFKDNDTQSKGLLSGQISHLNFSKWMLDLNITSNNLLVLNTTYNEDNPYYGTVFVSGDIFIKGPTEALVISSNTKTESGTTFVIPISETETVGASSYIHFITPDEKKAKLAGLDYTINNTAGLELEFNLDITNDAEIEIVLNKDTGHAMKGRGVGDILTQINTNGKFKMFGDFFIESGTYNFIYGGIIQKKFVVKPGGTLAWTGAPLKADMNITAIHKGITANPSILLDNPINQNIKTEVEIQLTGSLEQPKPFFNLNFPDVGSALNSQLQYRLGDNDTKEFQAISLLTTGNFRSDLTFRSQDAIGIFSDRIKTMVNELLSTNSDKIQFDFDYQFGENNPNFESEDRFIAGFTTKISDKILVNGNIGVPIGGVSESAVAGNVEIEVLLKEDRTLSIKFFNRERSIQTFGEQIGYTQGIGLSYNVEFDTAKELLHKIFKSKNKSQKKQN